MVGLVVTMPPSYPVQIQFYFGTDVYFASKTDVRMPCPVTFMRNIPVHTQCTCICGLDSLPQLICHKTRPTSLLGREL